MYVVTWKRCCCWTCSCADHKRVIAGVWVHVGRRRWQSAVDMQSDWKARSCYHLDASSASVCYRRNHSIIVICLFTFNFCCLVLLLRCKLLSRSTVRNSRTFFRISGPCLFFFVAFHQCSVSTVWRAVGLFFAHISNIVVWSDRKVENKLTLWHCRHVWF